MKRQEVWTISLAEAGAILAGKVGMNPEQTTVTLARSEGSEDVAIVLVATMETEASNL